jgi:hypothetical protein
MQLYALLMMGGSTVMDWLNSQAAVWYEEGISKLVSRYDKCLNVQGDCVEK